MALVMASKSPRRRELMSRITPHFQVDEADIDEAALSAPTPAALARLLAQQKAQAVFSRRLADVIIGCDTVVELEGAVLGKPAGPTAAAQMLQALSGKRHFVHTGVAVCAPVCAPGAFVETTAVHFSPLPPAEIEAYVRTEEPYDKAGAYGIQGWAARFIPRVEGCFYNVMGLPVSSLYHYLLQNHLL